MAILKQRIKKKNTSGTYDTLHIETNSNLVLMDNGNTLQYEMYNHTHTTGQISNFPSSMNPSYHTHSTGDIWNFPSTMTPSYHTHTKSQITDFPTSLPSMPTSSAPVGAYVPFDNHLWLVAHKSGSNMYLVLAYCDDQTTFGSSTTYSGSTLSSKCATFQNTMSSAALAKCINWTVNGVTRKVNIPSYGQYNGGFSYFTTNYRRICFNQQYYWTSSPYRGSDVWLVYSDGNLDNGSSGPSYTHGFRPCVCYVP